MSKNKGRIDKWGYTHYKDGSFKSDFGILYDKNGNGEDGSFIDKHKGWTYYPPKKKEENK